MRKTPLVTGEYYHIYNRGSFGQTLFKTKEDYARFLFGTLYFQSPIPFPNLSRSVKRFDPVEGFPVSEEETNDVLLNRFVELTAFSLMPNHYHLLVKQTQDGGIERYMQRIGTSYTMYFNTKNESSGRIFQGYFQSKHIADDHQLLYLSAYIHRNPRELSQWKDKIFTYPWSSLQDFTEVNRWGGLLMSDLIAGQFEMNPNSNYRDFVETSTAKLFKEEISSLL